MFDDFKTRFLVLFRELFVYHHFSLEFRAKLLALIISSNEKYGECEFGILNEVALHIYPNNHLRAKVLIDITKEYLVQIEHQKLAPEMLALDVDYEVSKKPSLKDKIDLELFAHFSKCQKNEIDEIYSQRIFEFLEQLKNEDKHIS